MLALKSNNFSSTFRKVVDKGAKQLQKYIENPNEGNVHDTRTSIRRLEASFEVLPKKIRTKSQIKKFIKSYKQFFKLNNKTRDHDIIYQKLQPKSSEEINKILTKLSDQRKNEVKKLVKKALTLKKIQAPKITKKYLRYEKIKKRFEKLTTSLINCIQQNIPNVRSNPKNIEKLHQLRMDCKKLRYLLELSINGKNDDTVMQLKKMQDILGTIHDYDITVDFLKKQRQSNEIKEICQELIAERMKKFQEI
jgi:CHAD domain-containing protein